MRSRSFSAWLTTPPSCDSDNPGPFHRPSSRSIVDNLGSTNGGNIMTAWTTSPLPLPQSSYTEMKIISQTISVWYEMATCRQWEEIDRRLSCLVIHRMLRNFAQVKSCLPRRTLVWCPGSALSDWSLCLCVQIGRASCRERVF